MNGPGTRLASVAAAALVLLGLAPACSSDGADTAPPPDGGGSRPGPDGAPSGSGGDAPADDAGTTGGASGSGGKPGSGGADAGAPIGTGGAAGEQTDSGTPPAESGAGAGPLVCDGPGARFATSVVGHEFGPGQNHGQDAFPAPLFGAPKGAGERNGSTDVVSLGNGGTVTVAFEGNGIADEPGPDFIVFENAFWAGGDAEQPFAELGTVAVSDDGVTWHEFPCTATQAPYGQCSGWRPVHANPDENALDPLDPAVAGGDPYDLSDIGVARARFVRVTDRVDLTGMNGVYDLDAVGIVHGVCN